MARKVIVHVGAPKTGTSFVQELLFGSRARLADLGICYPADRFDAHFLAALDLMQLTWGGLEREAVGAWDRLAAQVREWPETAIVSHEIMATASRAHVARALESLSTGDTEIHVVLTARDLVRQIPAEWQENVKHRRVVKYADFLAHLQDPSRQQGVASWFWGVQEVPDILDRWGSTLPRDRVHLVTVPPAGSPHELLWQRFSRVLGLDPKEFVLEDDVRTNASLGVAEAAVVRRLNEQVNGVVPNHHYRAIVREALVHQNLSRDRRSARLSVPPEVWQWGADLSRTWVSELALRGYDVVGDLDDLLPAPPEPFVDPDDPDLEEFADASVRALTAVTLEAARLRDREAELQQEIEDLVEKLDAAHSTRVYKLKERMVAKANTSRVAAMALAVYRRLRGRNSRST
jgi:Lon protease-like protein